jgi:hypothetical protein
LFLQFSWALRSWHTPALGRALVRVLVPAHLVRVLVVLAWVLGQEQVLVLVDLGQVVIRARMAMALAMERAMTVLVRQTVQALAQATAPVRAGLGQASV